jgi:hypothetical protein
MTAADVDLDALYAHAEAAAEWWDGYTWQPDELTVARADSTIATATTAPVAAFIAACDPDTIRALVQRVKDAEETLEHADDRITSNIADAEKYRQKRDDCEESMIRASEEEATARAERDDLLATLTALTALADTADQQATNDLGNLNDSGRVVPLGLVSTRKIRDLIHDHGGTT